MFVDNAKEIWDELKECFTQQNGLRIYELKKTLSNFLQKADSVNVYYGKLKTLWDELEIFDPLPKCSCEILKSLVERYHRDCVFQFLMRLHDAYANIQDQIMLIDPLPSLNKTFLYLQQQECQCQIASNNSSVDSVALLAKRGNENYKPT